MTSPAGRTRSARALRGGVAATAATGIALASHVAGGGAVPGLLGVLVPWAISLWLCTLLAGRRPAPWRTMLSVAASQALFHTLFVLGTPTGTSGGGHGAHAHHGQRLTLPAPSAATVDLLRADLTMWAWHVAAAAATAALLFHGEVLLGTLRRVAGAFAAWLLPALDLVPTTAPRAQRPAVVGAARRGARPGPQLAPLRRRGPPLLAV